MNILQRKSGEPVKKKKALNGYMTIEAAMLMPVVWFVLFFAIFMGFFLYDRCIAEQDCKIILLQASNMEETDETEIMVKIRERANLADQKKLLFSSTADQELSVTNKDAEIKAEGSVPTVLHYLWKDSGLSSFTYASEYKTDRYEPVAFIRNIRRLEKYVEG